MKPKTYILSNLQKLLVLIATFFIIVPLVGWLFNSEYIAAIPCGVFLLICWFWLVRKIFTTDFHFTIIHEDEDSSQVPDWPSDAERCNRGITTPDHLSHVFRDSPRLGGQICANCGTMKGMRRAKEMCQYSGKEDVTREM